MATSSFECGVCLRLMWRPSTLHCGHSFCQRCLTECMLHHLACPTCRVDVPFETSVPHCSFSLQEALTRMFPAETAEREAEEAALPAAPSVGGMPSLPLFVLEALMPGQEMALHVFEPRYIHLTRRALSDPALGRCLGMCAAPSGGKPTFGVTARILNHSELPGGRFYLRIVGVRRFRVLRTWVLDGYRNAQVAWAIDAPLDAECAAQAAALAADLRSACSEWISAVKDHGWERQAGQMDEVTRSLGEAPDAPDRLSLWAAALINPLPPLGVAPEIRLQAIEATEPLARMRIVLCACEASLERMRQARGPAMFGVPVGVQRVLNDGRIWTLLVAILLAYAIVLPHGHGQ